MAEEISKARTDEPTDSFRVVIDTRCRACAFALAGHIVGLGSIRGLDVNRIDGDGKYVRSEHTNRIGIQYHDGTPYLCAEHGRTVDLSRAP